MIFSFDLTTADFYSVSTRRPIRLYGKWNFFNFQLSLHFLYFLLVEKIFSGKMPLKRSNNAKCFRLTKMLVKMLA